MSEPRLLINQIRWVRFLGLSVPSALIAARIVCLAGELEGPRSHFVIYVETASLPADRRFITSASTCFQTNLSSSSPLRYLRSSAFVQILSFAADNSLPPRDSINKCRRREKGRDFVGNYVLTRARPSSKCIRLRTRSPKIETKREERNTRYLHPINSSIKLHSLRQ